MRFFLHQDQAIMLKRNLEKNYWGKIDTNLKVFIFSVYRTDV